MTIHGEWDRVVIHVGLPKAASTFLQRSIAPNVPGVTLVGPPFTQQHAAFNALQYSPSERFDASRISDVLTKIRSMRPDDHTLLLSDEHFSGLASYNFMNRVLIAERLASALPQARILVFLRNQVEFVRSLYGQFVRIGVVNRPLDGRWIHRPGPGMPIDRWSAVDDEWDLESIPIANWATLNPHSLRWSDLLACYGDRFGDVTVVLAEELAADQAAVLVRLSSLLGVSSIEPGPPVNVGGSPEDLKRTLVQNQLATLLPRLSPRARRRVARVAATFKRSAGFGDDEVRERLAAAGVFDDNRSLAERFKVDIGPYAHKYWPASGSAAVDE